jgi:hypothetical protein
MILASTVQQAITLRVSSTGKILGYPNNLIIGAKFVLSQQS